MIDLDKYGFVGLGDMGGPMATNLQRGGFQLIVYDKAGTENRAPSGAEHGDSIEDVARAAEVVFVSVPDAAASLDVVRSIVAVEDRNTRTLINLSTVGVEATDSIAKILTDFGVGYVDAPVSGGKAGSIHLTRSDLDRDSSPSSGISTTSALSDLILLMTCPPTARINSSPASQETSLDNTT